MTAKELPAFIKSDIRMGTYPVLRLSVSQKGTELLERFRTAVLGVGSIYHRKNRIGMCAWQVNNFAHAQAVIAMLWPFLGQIKRAQATRSVAVVTAYRARPEYRRRAKATQCKLGHQLENLGKQRGCKVCRERTAKAWRVANPDRVAAIYARYRAKVAGNVEMVRDEKAERELR